MGRIVVGKERDELRRQHAVHVARHRAEQARGREGRDPRRNRGAPRAQLDERPLEPLEQLVDVEQPLDLLPAQDAQLADF
ncbi:MAG TPA: hypothetical protein VGP56_02365 [Gaiellaceae bacterium]|nr:hypothetical protein [Gaiellaceae bacterium]